MRVRTVIAELGCTDARAKYQSLFDADVLLSSGSRMGGGEGLPRVALCPLAEARVLTASLGDRAVVLAYAGTKIAPTQSCPDDLVVVVAADSLEAMRARLERLPQRAELLSAQCLRAYRAFQESRDLRGFASRVHRLIGNPFVVVNTDRRVLTHAGRFPDDAGDVNETIASGYLGPAVEQQLVSDGVLDEARRQRHAVVTENTREGRRWVTSIMYYKGLEMGRLDVLECERQIGPSDVELIDYAGSFAGLIVAQSGSAGGRAGAGSSVLSGLLSKRITTEETMRSQLASTTLPLDVTYVLVLCKGRPGLAADDYRSHFSEMVERTLKGALWAVHEGEFVVMVSLGRSRHPGYDDYARTESFFGENRRLCEMMRNNDVRFFVSEPFSQLTYVQARFMQCSELADALSDEETPRVVLFWRYRYRVIANSVQTLGQVDMMLDKRVVAMYEYDRAHGTSYFETSVVSVLFPGSPGRAAEELCVHRNTYFYRTSKVKELFDLDLKDGEDRLAVSFTEHVMKGMTGFVDVY